MDPVEDTYMLGLSKLAQSLCMAVHDTFEVG